MHTDGCDTFENDNLVSFPARREETAGEPVPDSFELSDETVIGVASDEDAPVDERICDTPKIESIIEGILFAMGDSVEISALSDALSLPEIKVTEIIEAMAKKREEQGRGVRIIRLGDTFQMCTSKDVYEYLIRIAKQPKKYAMTDVLLETLSIIAYKQPITKAEIERIRGVSSDHAVNRLVEYGLCEEIGRLDAPGRPMLFGTTEEFLRSFGVTSLEDLPSLDADEVERMRLESYEEVDAQLSLPGIDP